MSSILKISDATSLALHAMIILSKNKDKLVSVKDIAASLDVSANHLSKVLQRLTKAGLVNSIKGYNGGFQLSKPAEDITFLDIYEVIEGKFSPSNCLLNRNACISSCVMGNLLTSVNAQVRDYFEKTKLSDFIK